jgi:hypothetical protein
MKPHGILNQKNIILMFTGVKMLSLNLKIYSLARVHIQLSEDLLVSLGSTFNFLKICKCH